MKISFDSICPIQIAKVNKYPKFDNNFDIRRPLEHFKYEMNRTLDWTLMGFMRTSNAMQVNFMDYGKAEFFHFVNNNYDWQSTKF